MAIMTWGGQESHSRPSYPFSFPTNIGNIHDALRFKIFSAGL